MLHAVFEEPAFQIESVSQQSRFPLPNMKKSDLIESMARSQPHLIFDDVELAVNRLLECMSRSLSSGERIEIRGFGSFNVHFRPPRMGRNPKTGDAVALSGKYTPHFKPGKEMKKRVNQESVASHST